VAANPVHPRQVFGRSARVRNRICAPLCFCTPVLDTVWL